MHLYKTIKNFLFDQEYFIDLWGNNIHVYGFLDILTLQENKASFRLEKFEVEFLGENFRVLKLTKNEILLQGTLKEMRVL